MAADFTASAGDAAGYSVFPGEDDVSVEVCYEDRKTTADDASRASAAEDEELYAAAIEAAGYTVRRQENGFGLIVTVDAG